MCVMRYALNTNQTELNPATAAGQPSVSHYSPAAERREEDDMRQNGQQQQQDANVRRRETIEGRQYCPDYNTSYCSHLCNDRNPAAVLKCPVPAEVWQAHRDAEIARRQS